MASLTPLAHASQTGLKPEIVALVDRYGRHAATLLRQAAEAPRSNDPGVRHARAIVERLDSASVILLPAMINAFYLRNTIDVHA